ncbi:hypothetical protein P3X46_000084 [Hevea brasiliensis]|uniref:rRNA N-glycosylase n=1 Tax=Hevea brasiliensis TaxID=3981 RepID=A0ABQ9N9U7_HEVBR|nr:hypothetical protein P3X46_000084 [Hevea brasiliensis]
MKPWIVVAVIWFFCTTVCGWAAVPPTVSFSTKGATPHTYSKFLKDLRDKLARGKYLLVELTNSKELRVTVALNVINVYVVAYKAGNTAFFFSDAPAEATDYLFKDKGTAQKKLKFAANRSTTNLGALALDDAIFTLDKYDDTQPKKIAGPLVVTIQMVAEAARFTYTERKVLSNFAQRFLPLDDVTSRENNRKSRSSGVQEADKNGNFPKPVQLQNSDGSANVVSTVAKAKPDMGILLCVAKNSTASLEQTVTTFWRSIVDLVKSFWFYAIAFIITVYAYRKLTSGLN